MPTCTLTPLDFPLQAVRALELIGRDVDKAKYAALAEEVRARQAAAAQTAAEQASGDSSERSRRARSYAAYQRRREARRRNIALERFKFWLGLPNKCVERGGGSGTWVDGWQGRTGSGVGVYGIHGASTCVQKAS